MLLIPLSQQIRSRWFHRLYQVVSLLLIAFGIGVFIYGIISLSEAKNEVYVPKKVESSQGLTHEQRSKGNADLAEMDGLIADVEARYATVPVEYGGRWKNPHILEFERDRAFHFMAIGFIPWIVLWLTYRAVLFVCMGTKAFVCSSS